MFTFSQLTAEEIMVPRVQMVALPIRPDASQLKDIFKNNPHSRYPVYSGDKDNIVGFVHIKDLSVLTEASEKHATANATSSFLFHQLHL